MLPWPQPGLCGQTVTVATAQVAASPSLLPRARVNCRIDVLVGNQVLYAPFAGMSHASSPFSDAGFKSDTLR